MPRRISLEPCASGLSNSPWRVNLPASVSSTGKRERRFFETKKDAETFCRQQRTRLENFGRNSSMLSPGQLEEAAMAFERLAPHAIALNTVVSDFIWRTTAKTNSVTFKTMFEHYVDHPKKGKKRSSAHLRGLKYTLPRFAKLHNRIVADLQSEEIEVELEGMTPAVRNAFLRILKAAFNHGIKRKWLEKNPLLDLDEFETAKNKVITLSPAEAESLMRAAEENNALLPYHAIGLFAGVRPLELERLEWRHVDLTEGHIEITEEVSKTGLRRIIEIEPNLKAWLTFYIAKGGETRGQVTPTTNLRKNLRDIRTTAGLVKWTQDVMRHSYASYWLAEHQDINVLTLRMGHESTAMLKHYNRASKKKDAALFWAIEPTPERGAGRKIVSISAA